MRVNHRPRVAGQSKYGLSRTVRVILDLITVKFLSSYSTRPIHIFGVVGLVADRRSAWRSSAVLGFERVYFGVPDRRSAAACSSASCSPSWAFSSSPWGCSASCWCGPTTSRRTSRCTASRRSSEAAELTSDERGMRRSATRCCDTMQRPGRRTRAAGRRPGQEDGRETLCGGNRIRRSGSRHVLCRERQRRHLRRHRRGEDRGACARGEVPIYEPGLEELIRRNVAQRRLIVPDRPRRRGAPLADSASSPSARRQGDNGEADLSAVMEVAEAIGDAMDGYRVIVDKSTVPVGTAAQVERVVRARTRTRLRRRLEPGVPQGRGGDRRFPEARPRDHRQPQRARDRAHGRALRALRAHRQPDPAS